MIVSGRDDVFPLYRVGFEGVPSVMIVVHRDGLFLKWRFLRSSPF